MKRDYLIGLCSYIEYYFYFCRKMIFYFSATGNSRHVALRMAEATGDRMVSVIDCMNTDSFEFDIQKDERIGFVCPVYFWGIPEVMNEFMSRMKLNTCVNHYVYTIVSYGTTTGQAGWLLGEALKKKGIKRDAHFAIGMVDTYTPMFDVSDRDKCNRKSVRAEKTIDKVAHWVMERRCVNRDRLRLYHPLAAIYTYLNKNPKTKPFSINERCIGCGVCAKDCPTQAIKMENGRPSWVKDHCMTCLRCLHHCPTFAIQYGKRTERHGQFVYRETNTSDRVS